MSRFLEACVDSLASARQAIAGGADRLELCNALIAGGLTPYTLLLQQIREESDIPIRCLMRPRAGDFLYTPEELELLRRQILELKAAGADGFVLGCLTPDGALDTEAMAPLMEACGDCGVTLHRCIDVSADPQQTYRDAMRLGIDTVLTSGCAASCSAGQATLKSLIALRDTIHGPEVLIAGGLTADVVIQLRQEIPGARAFHTSGKTNLDSGMRFRRQGVPMGLPGLDEWHIPQTDLDLIRAVRAAVDA